MHLYVLIELGNLYAIHNPFSTYCLLHFVQCRFLSTSLFIFDYCWLVELPWQLVNALLDLKLECHNFGMSCASLIELSLFPVLG